MNRRVKTRPSLEKELTRPSLATVKSSGTVVSTGVAEPIREPSLAPSEQRSGGTGWVPATSGHNAACDSTTNQEWFVLYGPGEQAPACDLFRVGSTRMFRGVPCEELRRNAARVWNRSPRGILKPVKKGV